MADFDVAFQTSEINLTLVLENTVGEGGAGVTSWNDLEDKPSTFPPSTHNHDDLYFSESEVTSALALKSDTSHNHDDRYFTESEITALLSPIGKLDRPFKVAINDYFLTTIGLGAGYAASGTSSTAANSNNRGKFTPFYIGTPTTIDALALYCVGTNGGASAVVRLGIYADNDGRPGGVVVDAGTASINTATLKTLTFTPVTLQPGFYWAVGVPQNLDTAGGNPTFAGVSGTQAIGDSAPAASNNMFAVALATISGALTANPTIALSRATTGSAMHIWARRSA